MLDQQCVVPFVWVGRVLALSSRRLVPGDVVVLQRGKATCDMVLLRGAGLVEESMLSGEVRPAAPHGFIETERGNGHMYIHRGKGRGFVCTLPDVYEVKGGLHVHHKGVGWAGRKYIGRGDIASRVCEAW